jgi:mannose-1-phosphate guanylyltransferase/mannose-6-phosphate isomerase
MLQETVARLSPLVPLAHVLVVTGRAHARAVRAQLGTAVSWDRVLVEPQGRNTAAAIALAALWLARRSPDAIMVVLPADHAIPDRRRFQGRLRQAIEVAERTAALVTLGVTPTYAETGYGYIAAGAPVAGQRGHARWVERFIEKPDRSRAERMLAEGGVYWNAGIFVWRVSVVLEVMRALVPEVVRPLEEAAARRSRDLAAAYRRVPPVSIDVGVLERAPRVAVVPARFAWNDVGSWAAVETLWRNGAAGGNAVRGRAVAVDSRGCVVDSPARLVALLGVEDLVVVDTPDALLVCRKDRAQDVRLVVGELERRGLTRHL